MFYSLLIKLSTSVYFVCLSIYVVLPIVETIKGCYYSGHSSDYLILMLIGLVLIRFVG